jgi:hypothetical protein
MRRRNYPRQGGSFNPFQSQTGFPGHLDLKIVIRRRSPYFVQYLLDGG